MKQALTVLMFLIIGTLQAQNPLSQIEGFLEVYLSTDSTSLYIGKNAGQKVETTQRKYNVFIGSDAGKENTTGRANVFIGDDAGKDNISGSRNVFIGEDAGSDNTSGSYNVFIGEDAGEDNESGEGNVIIGYEAGDDLHAGDNNTLIGNGAGYSIDSTNYNTCLGYYAGEYLSGDYNTFIGSSAGQDADNGEKNVGLGYYAGYDNDGNFNTFLGSFAGYSNDADKNVFVGYEAGYENVTGLSNSFLGFQTGRNNRSGSFNVFFGNDAGLDNHSGNSNVFVGSGSGKANISGGSQVYIGNGAGSLSKAGLHSVCIGSAAGLFDTLISTSVYIGHNAGALSFSNQGSRSGNVFLGNFAGYNHRGSNKLFISNTSVDSTEALVYGEFNNNVLRINADLHVAANSTNGNSRILMKGIGGALNEVVRYDGDENDVVLGSVTGAGGKLHLRANGDTKMSIIENGNVGIGITNPTADLHVNGTVKIEVLPPLPGTNDLRYTSDGIISRSSSDRRLKTDIITLEGSLERVLDLRGVSYVWKDDKTTGVQIGMIAQEVQDVVPELVNQGEDGFYSIDYTEAVGLLVEAIKDQQKIINELTKTNKENQSTTDLQSDRISQLELLVSSLIERDSVQAKE